MNNHVEELRVLGNIPSQPNIALRFISYKEG